MGLRNISLLAVVWSALFVGSNAEAQESDQEKRPIKTFKTMYGEIIDCIDIYKQPAFDHPLLKDHKLQKKPSFSLNATKHRQRAQVKQLERSHLLDGCPDGTIPILRTTKEDKMRAKLLEQTRPQIYQPFSSKYPGYHFAFLELGGFSNPFQGATAFIDNYTPKCEKGQFSGAQIWVISDINKPTNNMIQVGWRVDPISYNDDHSHFFIYWKAGGSGCFDLQCPGFVQVDHSVTLGQALLNSSVYEGPQFEIRVAIEQDGTTKDWWLMIEKDNDVMNVGYWPAKLLPDLTHGAYTLQYGGVTYASKGMAFPPMGSGYFPDKSYSHACYFRQIRYMDGSRSWKVPESYRVSTHTSSEHCYGAAVNDASEFMGYTFLFGGPGGAKCGV